VNQRELKTAGKELQHNGFIRVHSIGSGCPLDGQDPRPVTGDSSQRRTLAKGIDQSPWSRGKAGSSSAARRRRVDGSRNWPAPAGARQRGRASAWSPSGVAEARTLRPAGLEHGRAVARPQSAPAVGAAAFWRLQGGEAVEAGKRWCQVARSGGGAPRSTSISQIGEATGSG